MPYIGKKPADIIATVIDTTTGTFSGEVDAGSLDVSGNADIDGITNLDNTDIDGTLDVSGNLTVDTNTLFVDSANNRVGVGTNSPELELHIKGSGNQSLRLETTDSTYIGFDIQQNSDGSGQILLRDSKPLIFYTNSSEAMRIDNNGNVGINTSSPNTTNLNSGTTSGIVVKSGGVAKNNFVALPSTGGSQWDVRESGGSGGEFSMRMFDTSGTHNVQISSNGNHFFNGGNVGIGTSSPSYPLEIHSSSGQMIYAQADSGDANIRTDTSNAGSSAYFWARATNTGSSAVQFGDPDDADVGRITYDHSDNSLAFKVNASERMRIDSSGNLLVSHTSAYSPISNGGSGSSLMANGQIFGGSTSPVLYLNREDSDGDIVVFRKDGTTIGNIGVEGGNSLYIHSGDTGVRFSDSSNKILPVTTAGSARDNAITLGSSGARFQDLYLSGKLTNDGSGGINIDGSGNVGIGTSSPASLFGSGTTVEINGSGGAALRLARPSYANGDLYADENGLTIRTQNNYQMRFLTNNTLAATIDTSGRLLVGTTANSPSDTAGINLDGSIDKIHVTRSGGSVAYFNRLTSDGSIVDFVKDGGTVGSIGVLSSRLYIGNTDTALFFNDSSNAVTPYNVTSATQSNGVIDLGTSGTRFKDLYLSGGAYIGGTGSANFLDDYEEGTYEPTFTGSSAGTLTLQTTYRTLAYTKIGRQVTITGRIRNAASGTISGALQISLPFATASLTQEADIFSGSVLVRDLDVPTNTFDLNVLGEGGTSVIEVYASIDNGVWHDIDANDSPQNAYYVFGFSYFTDS